MQAVKKNSRYHTNRITTPLRGKPSYVNSGIIKTVINTGEKISIGQIDYQEFDEENFQYVISPYWDIIDGLPETVFQGIPGINMELRLPHYYRANYIPTFIAERTPSENREDLWDLLESVGLDYYDRFEWLLRTTLRSSNDNLIVERRNLEQRVEKFSKGIISSLQYGDRLIVDSMASIAQTSTAFTDGVFDILASGIDVFSQSGQILSDAATRTSMLSVLLTQKLLLMNERRMKRKEGINNAKKSGKYQGRKPVEVDENVLQQVAKEYREGIITIDEAMKRAEINSKSTFYRKLRRV